MKKPLIDLSQNKKSPSGDFVKKGLHMKKKDEFFNAVKGCKKIIRSTDKSIRMTVEKWENEYYNTEIISVKNKITGKEIFTLRVVTDPESVEYNLYRNDNKYKPKNWYQNRKIKKLRKTAERYAIKRYAAYIRG